MVAVPAAANNRGRLRSLTGSRHGRLQVIGLTGHRRATAGASQADSAGSFPSPAPSNPPADSRLAQPPVPRMAVSRVARQLAAGIAAVMVMSANDLMSASSLGQHPPSTRPHRRHGAIGPGSGDANHPATQLSYANSHRRASRAAWRPARVRRVRLCGRRAAYLRCDHDLLDVRQQRAGMAYRRAWPSGPVS
jgi:hypothetical protein